MALWVNALNGIWMPVSLTLLGVVAGNRRVMGRQALSWCVRLALWGLAAGFALLAGVGLAGGL
jgi:Mn2+/Fe2+ NRAMP family transporter